MEMRSRQKETDQDGAQRQIHKSPSYVFEFEM